MGGEKDPNNGTFMGWEILLGVTIYTVICMTVGFFFKCRKTKWRKTNNIEKNHNIGYGAYVQEPASWVDSSPYICAVDEVIENSLFDSEMLNGNFSDTDSIRSDNSSQAHDLLEDMFGSGVDNDAWTRYELYENKIDNCKEGSDEATRQNEVMSKHIAALFNIEKENLQQKRTGQNATSKCDTCYDSQAEPKDLTNKQHDAKVEVRKLIRGRQNRRFKLKKREKRNKGKNKQRECGENGSRSLWNSLKNIKNKQSSYEKELVEKEKHKFNGRSEEESFECLSEYEAPEKVEKSYQPGLMNCQNEQISKKRELIAEGLVDASGEEGDTLEKDMQESFDPSLLNGKSEQNSKRRELIAEGLVDTSGEKCDTLEKEMQESFDPSLLNGKNEQNSRKRDFIAEGLVDTSGEGSDTFEKEMQEIRNLSIPWTFSSFISYFASIVAIALIANFMNVASMIAYSYVWFIIDAAFIYSSALYNSLYKHVNNAIASKTEEGYTKAGKYIRVCIIINLIISIPISIGVVLAMDPIMEFYGFHDVKVQGYAIIAVIHNFFSYTSSFVTISSDIDGYADFNAKYAFLDSLVDILISAFVIPLYKPTLVQLGLIHLANEILSTSVYYFLTWSRWGWYDRYKAGLGTSLTYDRKDKKALSTLIKKSIPMTLDELNGELEWLVSAYLASFIGQSASSAWVLLSYIWGLIDVVPSCIGSAVEYRVAYQLSKGNIELSKQISSRSMDLTCITSLIGTACFFFARHPLINFITHDDEISQQLFSVMPYIVLCQPLISLSTNGAYLNRALAMYRRSTKVELLITCLITLPLAGAATFVFGLGIEGLLAASFIGYATTGAVILAIYNNADWEKAVRKNMKIAGTLVTSKVASFGKEVV